jgi:hypothetical protein
MLELPYTIRIPHNRLGMDNNKNINNNAVDTIIVHAGFIPGIDLEEQNLDSMITIREVIKNITTPDSIPSYVDYQLNTLKYPHMVVTKDTPIIIPWANAWDGPYRVIFGHDAKRGLQIQNKEWAIGLDTGCCYGKQLTGLLLPEYTLVQVDAVAEHFPI